MDELYATAELIPATISAVADGHDPKPFPEFRERYREELRGPIDQINELRVRASDGPVTIV